MTMRQYTEKYEVDIERTLSILRSREMELDPDGRLRDEATRLGTDPEGLILLLNGDTSS